MVTAIVLAASAVALYTDLKYRIIPNKLTFSLIVFAFLYHAIYGDPLLSLAGFALGFAFMIVPFIAGGMGGGDVKFMAMLGALAGPLFVTQTFVLTCVIGGILAVALLVKQKALWRTVREIILLVWWYLGSGGAVKLTMTKNGASIPYAACFFLAIIAALHLNNWKI